MIAVLLLSGCGYQVRHKASLPFSEINIGRIESRTVEPKLQDRLHRALTEEFMKNGVTVTPAAKDTLVGVVNAFQMASISEKSGITVEYSITVNAEFTLLDNQGKPIVKKSIGSPFIVAFTGSEDLATLIGSKELAEEKAAKDIAVEVVGALLYR